MLLLHLAYSEEDLKFKAQSSKLNERQYRMKGRAPTLGLHEDRPGNGKLHPLSHFAVTA